MKNKVYIVGHSLSPQSAETITVLATFPRIILSEINTHRMLSKNTSSSRAIPFEKMLEAVQNNPFTPFAWQKYHPGMQGSEYLDETVKYDLISFMDILNNTISNTEDEKERARLSKRIEEKTKIIKELLTPYTLLEKTLPEWWLFARDKAVEAASILYVFDVTKQLCNILLEPFMWTTMLITGSKEGWQNFFNLRCPSYKLIGLDEENVKSRKEWLEKIQFSSALHPSMYPKTDVEWLQINKGQAEIHIMDLAEKIYDAVNESTPKQLQAGEWHIPMISDLESLKLSTDDQIKLSVGRAANTSYTVVGDGKELTLEHAIKIHDKCVELVHSSVFEHCARAMSDEEYYSFIKGKVKTGYIDESEHQIFLSNKSHNCGDYSELGWCNNLKGFMPYRYFIDNKIEI